MLTETEKYAVWLSLQTYATHKDFTAEDWLQANTMVRESRKLQIHINRFKK